MSKKLVVLGVDDDPINMKLLERIVSKYEHLGRFEKATNGQEAINQIKKLGDIDVVLLDIHMPIMNGLQFLEERMQDVELKKVPVIMLTTDESKKNESLDLGANDFLMKPIIKPAPLHEKLDIMLAIVDD